MILSIALPLIVAAVVALASPLVLYPLLARAGVVDIPNERSSHHRVTTRGGGVAQLAAVWLSGTIAVVCAPSLESQRTMAIVIGGALLTGVLGFVEDARGVRIAVRAGTQLAIGGVVALMFVTTTEASWWLVPTAALGFATYVNFTNFMDGINGISGLHGAVVGVSYAALGSILHVEWLTVVGAIIAIAFVCFLPWNFTPPGVFMGDVGSYLLGAAIAASAMAAHAAGIPPLSIAAPLTIYLADTSTVIIKRVLRREKWFQPHRQHVYQRLVDAGASHLATALVVTLLSGLAALVGVALATRVIHSPSVAIAILTVIAFAYLSLPHFSRIKDH
ncbi:UDP-N-acetylmuramyl pentapeptide phosphotransferase/UDP-N-acetylglucosamine-1-phosphate transferase [Tessaracoccus oleiagri]|uniref:UDP-N-acetylmuramyl pentapeptide phosphotransferase/UDP-N-acetylglucosamine-1-phosphate transferase n=2 Tax=Tessaracoccus oleiagri TaxID=686624 RepID=A0A1G9KFL2_9ACTN|nr:UDP-N-acetylmuramyl pentapeptide phosphotransferase/UDP-N-acetylglucosamine-1-phosphate transferase [Tessaracoccus oleiagri]